MITPVRFTSYFQASRDGFRTKSNRINVIKFDCVRLVR